MAKNFASKIIVILVACLLPMSHHGWAGETELALKVASLEKQMAEMINIVNWQKDKILQLENQSVAVKITPPAQQTQL